MEVNIDKIRKEFDKYNLDYWDFRFEEAENKQIIAWNKEIKRNSSSSSNGFSVRVLLNGSWGFACSTGDNILEIIKKAIRLAKIKEKKEKTGLKIPKSINDRKETKQKINFNDIDEKDKVDFLLNLSKKALGFDSRIKSAMIRYGEILQNKIFLSQNSFINQKITKGRILSDINAKSSEGEEQKLAIFGHTGGYEFTEKAEEEILKVCKRAIKFLHAKKGVSGEHPVIIDGILAGLLVHEALGHASEADSILQESGCLVGRFREKISGENVNIFDDATENDFTGWGCYYYDDEGVKAQKTSIIKKGILNSYLHNIESSSKLNMPLTGNARAENVFNIPIIRMSNTYIEKSDSNFDEMLKKMKNGYYMSKSIGGQVDPTSGNFQFSASDVYKIENGEIKEPLKSMSFGGNLLEILKNILLIENKYDSEFPGMCSKSGQHVPASGTCPKVYLKKAIVN